MFERFTHGAREAVIRAQHEARELHQSPVGTQHLLLGMLADESAPVAAALREQGVTAESVRAEVVRRVGPSPAAGPDPWSDDEDAAALKAIGIDLEAVRKAIEENFGPGSLRLPRDPGPQRRRRFFKNTGGRTPFSPRSKKVLELSLREALRLKHDFIAQEHILLGILREGDGLAAQVLADAGVDFDKLRDDLTRSLHALS